MPAPRNPCNARHTIICSIEVAKPQRKLETVKPKAEIANNNRVPSARDRKPDNGIAITSAIRYAVWTHDTSVELADSPAWISVREAETIWMSRIDMNIPNTMIRNANSRRAGMRSDDAVVRTGDAGLPSAIVCSSSRTCAVRETGARNLLRAGHGRRIQGGFAVGIGGVLPGVDGGVDRHARAQQVLSRDVLWHPNPDWKPLHDLDEIAGGVVRRQQSEH